MGKTKKQKNERRKKLKLQKRRMKMKKKSKMTRMMMTMMMKKKKKKRKKKKRTMKKHNQEMSYDLHPLVQFFSFDFRFYIVSFQIIAVLRKVMKIENRGEDTVFIYVGNGFCWRSLVIFMPIMFL